MAYPLNDNPLLEAGKHLDARYGPPWESLEQAFENIPKHRRVIGLPVGIIVSGKVIEYWFESGIEDADLVKKSGDKHYKYPINHLSNAVIQHMLDKEPAVQLRDEEGNICIANIIHIDENHTQITTAEPFTGVAIFN